MSDSDDIELPSSHELDKAAEVKEEKRASSVTSSESEKENDKSRHKSNLHHSDVLMEVNETKTELKYRSKYFKDPEDVITNRKLRCTACNIPLQSIILEGRDIYRHPVLKVLLCKRCIDFYGNGDLSIDEDGTGKYCRWCAQGGMLYCCADCCNAFCKACIKRNLSRSVLVTIESKDWKCFVCDGEPLWEMRAICSNAYVILKQIKRKKKEDNEKNLKKLEKKRKKLPGQKNSRQLNSWQKNAVHMSTSSDDDNEHNLKNRKSKKSKTKRKLDKTSSGSDGGKPVDKKRKQHDSDSDIKIIEYENECIVVKGIDEELNKTISSKSNDRCDEDEMPDQVDPEGAKEVNELLTEHLNDIIQTGELIAYRAKRLLNKKVSGNNMLDPKKVGKVMDSVNLLVKLAGENMQHTVEFLTSQHKHWVKQVKKRYRNAETKSQSLNNKTETVKEKKGDVSDTKDNTLDTKIVKHNKNSGNDVIANVIESNEDEKSLMEAKRNVEKSTTKKNEEKIDTAMENDTSGTCEIAMNNDNADETTESKCITTKRKIREGDNSNTELSEIQINKKQKTSQENHEIEFEKSNSEAQVKKTKGKNCKDDITSTVSKEELVVEEEKDGNEKNSDLPSENESFTSKSTLRVELNDSQVDIFDNSSVQEEIGENIPFEGEDEEQHKSEDKDKSDSSYDTATIELICSQGSDKYSVESNPLSDDVSSLHKSKCMKREVDRSLTNNLGDSNEEERDPLALNKSDSTTECNSKIHGNKSTKSKENADVNHEEDAVSGLENEKDVGKPELDDINIDNLKASNNVSTDSSVESMLKESEDEESDKKYVKAREKKEEFTADCMHAQEALIGYTSDEEGYTIKKKKKEKRKKSKEVDDKKKDDAAETEIKKKKHIGPKSRILQFSSASSATDTESDSSDGMMTMKGKYTNKKKLRLKDTEAYKNDKKLGWKFTVDVDRLSEEEFKKYYENYYTEEEDELAKKAKDDKEIESLVNLKSLKQVRSKISEESLDESDAEDSDDITKSRKKSKRKKDKKKEQEQRLIDFFNEEDDNYDASSKGDMDQSDPDSDISKSTRTKDAIAKDSEMAMKIMLSCFSSDDGDNELNDEEEESKKDTKKKKKESRGNSEKSIHEDKTDVNEDGKLDVDEEKEPIDKISEEEKGDDAKADVKEDEKIETEVKKEDSEEDTEKKEDKKENKEEGEEDKGDEKMKSDDSDSPEKSEKPNKKNWRTDKLLTEKLTDLDTSDEEHLWNKKKQREMKDKDSDSDVKSKDEKKFRKKIKRRIFGSDESDDTVNVPSSSSESESSREKSSDSDVFEIKKKKKKKKKGKKSESDDNSDSSSDFKTKKAKAKRRRIKAPASDSSSKEDDEDGPNEKSGTPGKGRKKIHHILSDDNVAEATRKAAKEEEERRRRISEKQKLYNEIYNEAKGSEKLEKLILDFDPETKKELVSVDPNLVAKLKPHQAQGIKFMWDACFESLKHIKKNKGSGCILAHCMGLGKTLQIVALVHTLLNHKETAVKNVLVICPLTTVLNWANEFNKWLKDGEVNVFELTRYKQIYERQYQLKEWMDCGGVMILGYEMYRNLTNPQAKRFRKKAIETFQSTLIDPGPDLIVCDEGHVLKNEDSAIAKALRKVKTMRRILLTGTPLQNNLKEYHCMIQFVKPNLLGNRKEFLNRFVNPITNGQFEDSTPHDVKIMKRRAHVLHKMLEGSIQRFDYSVLTPFLPPKHEYVIFISLHEMQVKAYRHYLDFFARSSGTTKGAQLFKDFSNLQKIWTHPRVLKMSDERDEKVAERKRLMESDSEGSLKDFIDDDDDGTTESSDESSAEASSKEDSDVHIVGSDGEKKENKSIKSNKFTRSTRSKGPVKEPEDVEKIVKQAGETPSSWWKQFIVGDELENINYSGKLILLFSILKECEKIGDKVLVFSQSLLSLNLIEYFLGQIDAATQNDSPKKELGNHTSSWTIGLDYFRLDGSSNSENRHIWCKSFNHEDNHRARLFLISTKAGGLGINLYAANRVIIFDASWNPSHDVQSIFRVYRFGQKKPCYIYRFLAQGTMEEKVYDRQVTKLSLSCRVVDEQQIERHYNMADLQELYQFDPEQKTKQPTPILPKDRLLAELLKEHENWIITYHEHDSLLENKEEEELNEDERKAAWEEYENEKKGKVFTNVQVPGANLNMVALREALRNENPHATNEELEKKMTTIIGQIYDYLNNQNAATAQQTYTATQMQALQQYQIQQQQMLAQREKQIRMQQDLSLRKTSYNPGTSASFQQYIQNNQNLLNSNLYRNANFDKSGVLKLQSKLVSINPDSSASSRVRIKNFGTQDMGPNHLKVHQPVMLPQSSTFLNLPAHGSNSVMDNLLKILPNETKAKDLNKKSVPDDVIETIE